MSRKMVRRHVGGWLLRHSPILWVVLLRAWPIFWLMCFLLCWLFGALLLGYLDPDGGMAGVWYFGILFTASGLILGALFACRGLCMMLAVPDALLKALDQASGLGDGERARLQKLITSGDGLNYRTLLRG